MTALDDVDWTRLIELPSAELHVMIALLALGTREKQAVYCRTTKRELSSRTHLSERSVQTQLGALEKRDLVRRCGCNGRETAFWLNAPRRTGTGQSPASAPDSFGSSSQVREYLISTNSSDPPPSRGAKFAEQGSIERPSRSATDDPPARQSLPSRSAKSDQAALPPHPPENPELSEVFSSSEINSAQGRRSACVRESASPGAHAPESPTAAAAESGATVERLRAFGFGPGKVAEFAGLSTKLVQAAIDRAAEIEEREGGGWTLNRRRALVAGLLRKGDFRAEVESDTTRADQEREREEAQRQRAARAQAKREAAQQLAMERAQREREEAAHEARSLSDAIDGASDSDVSAALQDVASTLPGGFKALDSLRSRGHSDRVIAKLARFRAAVIARIHTTPSPIGAP